MSDNTGIETAIRSGKIDNVLALTDISEKQIDEIIKLCSIYGIGFSYPRIPTYISHSTQYDRFIGGIPVIESLALAMSPWDRIAKRTLDILLSVFFLILLIPLFLVIMLSIWIEDPS